MLPVPCTGTIKATCLIETLPAAFEMDEFLYELRDHAAGLNCGRWDYIFSFIKTMRADPRWAGGRVGGCAGGRVGGWAGGRVGAWLGAL